MELWGCLCTRDCLSLHAVKCSKILFDGTTFITCKHALALKLLKPNQKVTVLRREAGIVTGYARTLGPTKPDVTLIDNHGDIPSMGHAQQSTTKNTHPKERSQP